MKFLKRPRANEVIPVPSKMGTMEIALEYDNNRHYANTIDYVRTERAMMKEALESRHSEICSAIHRGRTAIAEAEAELAEINAELAHIEAAPAALAPKTDEEISKEVAAHIEASDPKDDEDSIAL